MKMKKDLEKENVDTQNKYKDIIFGNRTRIYNGCLYEPQGQGAIDRCMYHERQKKHRVQDICPTLTKTAEEDGVLTDRRTFFIRKSSKSFYDHWSSHENYHRMGVFHNLHAIHTLDTWSTCDFL